LLEAEENIKMVRENLKIAQSRQRSYADTRRRELSFEVGDFVNPTLRWTSLAAGKPRHPFLSRGYCLHKGKDCG
jgi:hypothetical protein